MSAYNFAKHLKAIRWKTPFEAICQAWTKTPDIFELDPVSPHPGTKQLVVPSGLQQVEVADPKHPGQLVQGDHGRVALAPL